ncbi:MAG TPA: hypothetical protein VFY03_01700 [Woeseiaceae bacterium]|nr:hypothetical protein [Woeseiaceae bacterium]
MKKFGPHARIAAAYALVVFVALVTLGASNVAAAEDEDDEAEITIRLMGSADAERPEAVTEQIVLPPAAREDTAAVENARRGGERGNDDRDSGREHGLATADEARERGAEMSEEARENAENRGRSEERPDPPGRPDDPGPPDNPGPPD